MSDRHQVLGNDLTDTCLGALYIRYEPEVLKHCRFERKIAQELVYQISDLDYLIYSPKPQVHTIYCRNSKKKLQHLDQASKVTDTNFHVKLEKLTITSDSIASLANDPLYYDWLWDPLEMPSVTLKDPGHINFMLNNQQKFLAKVRKHSENATTIDKLLISIVISPKLKNYKIALFFRVTSTFISVSILVKMYATTKYTALSILKL
jgi:hypothetical protein